MLQRIHKRLDIEYVAAGALSPDPCNPRRHSKRQIERLKRGIRSVGFLVPILCDRNGTIIAGHARHMAARELGLIEVPVIRIEGLSEAQVKAFQIADNRLTDLSDWNAEQLAETLNELVPRSRLQHRGDGFRCWPDRSSDRGAEDLLRRLPTLTTKSCLLRRSLSASPTTSGGSEVTVSSAAIHWNALHTKR
jgi:hypothetical protein